MTLGTSSGNPVQNLHSSSNEDRAALEGMLKSYPVEQLIDEVLIAWEELAQKNDEMVNLKQKMRILELDLAEREDAVAPELAQLENVNSELTNAKGRIVHLERLLEDAKNEIQENRTSVSVEIKEKLETEALSIKETYTRARPSNCRIRRKDATNGHRFGKSSRCWTYRDYR